MEPTFEEFKKKLNEAKSVESGACPDCLSSNQVNIANHKKTIKAHNLGPADPTIPNKEFWQAKGDIWKCTEGDARGRLCMNCEHYLSTKAILECIDKTESKNFKTSMIDPAIVDIESKPVAICMLYNITCSPTRTCDSQEMGGPIDDVKAKLLDLVKLLNASFDIDEYKNPFETK